MKIIEFETPTLNEKGEILARTRCTVKQFTEDLCNDVGLDLRVIPAGNFLMGSPRHLGTADEQPPHFVTIQSFMISKCLITQAQWKAIMGKLPPCRFKGDGLPVERVPWDDAQKFCQKLSRKTGQNY